MMKCFYCQSEMKKSQTVYTKEINDRIIVIKHVPCFECEECGEKAYTADVLIRIEEIVDSLTQALTEVAVVNYSAA